MRKQPSQEDLEWIRRQGIENDPEGHYGSMTKDELVDIWEARVHMRQRQDPAERRAWQRFRGRDRLDETADEPTHWSVKFAAVATGGVLFGVVQEWIRHGLLARDLLVWLIIWVACEAAAFVAFSLRRPPE